MTRVCISGYEGMFTWVRGYVYPVRGYACEGMYIRYEGMYAWGTRVCISGVRGYVYPGFEGMNIRGTRVCISGVRGYVYKGHDSGHDGMNEEEVNKIQEKKKTTNSRI